MFHVKHARKIFQLFLKYPLTNATKDAIVVSIRKKKENTMKIFTFEWDSCNLWGTELYYCDSINTVINQVFLFVMANCEEENEIHGYITDDKTGTILKTVVAGNTDSEFYFQLLNQ